MTLESQPEGRVGFGSSEVLLATPKLKKITQTLARSGFTDNTDATGRIDLTTQLPAGAIPVAWKANVTAAFIGNVSAVIQVGVSGDLDRFSAVTDQSVFTAGIVGASALARDDSLDGIGAAQTIRVTVTGATDFTSISAGSMDFEFYYIDTTD